MTSEDSIRISPQDLFYLVNHKRRRILLRRLGYLVECSSEADPEIAVDELAQYVAGIEFDMAPCEVDRETRRGLETSLDQHHLPLLDDYGLVEYDEDDRTASCALAIEDVVGLLEGVESGIRRSELIHVQSGDLEQGGEC